ncbi:hypothetical protein O3P69_013663 [Scylla paramamosain]|uniref:Major facilitator superfamily (MFS) profile domain-containing protein n=1 Tax=Scylla paramamosain TaxID=85552 RepID=A0AAW0SQC3_SCYPA
MVAEPSQDEVEPHTSNDDLQNDQPPLGAAGGTDLGVASNGRHGTSALSSSPEATGGPRSESGGHLVALVDSSEKGPMGMEEGCPPGGASLPQMTGAASSPPRHVRPARVTHPHRQEICSTVCSRSRSSSRSSVRSDRSSSSHIDSRRDEKDQGEVSEYASDGEEGEGKAWGVGVPLPDLSEYERVWEAAPEVIIRPASLASSETLTPDSPSPSLSSALRQPSAFSETQENLRQGDDPGAAVGAVGGGGRACGCGVQVGGLEEASARCPACPPPAPVYVSEQFPSTDPLEECVDGSGHTLHVDLSTGAVQLHLHLRDANKLSPVAPADPAKCLADPLLPPAPAPATSSQPDPAPPPASTISFSSGIGEASVYHALVVIFLEFFAWGLLTSPMITVLNDTFPDHTFLMNGLIVGIKGLLSFLSAPLIGALSDLWGRKFFLFITVFFTCLPIPFMKINTWWYFALISMSGVFAVTFSIVFAYVADVTDESERSSAYGLVSATFAASLVTSPALGAYLGKVHSDDLVVGLATAIAILDVFFILVAVPESLPEKLRLSSSWSAHISWEQADPFSALWKVGKDRNVLLISVSVFLSYLPEAGQYSCFFVYLRLVMDFSAEMVATFIAVVGILSVVAQTALLSLLMKKLSNKHVIMVGLTFELLQLMWYGFGSKIWMMWAAGLLASVSSITYPAISAYVSTHTDADKQGVVQGIITGMRGLCSGLGPAVFGFIFYLFHVDLSQEQGDDGSHRPNGSAVGNGSTSHVVSSPNLVPGPPFVFGALLVICALMVAAFIPEGSIKSRKQSGSSLELNFERGHKRKGSMDAASLPLMDETGVV